MSIRAPFKIHGGKYYLKHWVLENFPKNYETFDYLEPFCGAGNVMLNKNKTAAPNREMINDLHEGVINIFRSLRDEPEAFIRKIKKIEYTQKNFDKALKKTSYENELDHAINEFVLRRMSRGGLKKAFGWSDRERGGKPGDVNAWETIIEQLPKIAERLKDTFIFNKPAVQIINAFNYENMLLYCDPPYVQDVRVSKEVYDYEMTTDEHIQLAEVLNNFSGKVILSGYPSTLYKRLYKDWKCIRKKVANHSSQQKVKDIKVECLWTNY